MIAAIYARRSKEQDDAEDEAKARLLDTIMGSKTPPFEVLICQATASAGATATSRSRS